jgi:CheY-like chemotaxis protein
MMAAILVIDDDNLVRATTRAILAAKGHEVVVAEDGAAGIEAAKLRHFDLAIIDLFMPGMDGLQVIETIRQSHPNLPMVAVSGFMFGGKASCPEMPNFDTMVQEAGATAALYKPFRPDDLLGVVSKALGIAQERREAVLARRDEAAPVERRVLPFRRLG